MFQKQRSNIRKNSALLRRLSSRSRQSPVDSAGSEDDGTIAAFFPTNYDEGCGYASRSLYEGFLPKPANFIVQGCGDMELAQAAPQAEQTADPCIVCRVFLHVVMVVMALCALAMAGVLVFYAVGSFLWHIALLCVMSAALLMVWCAYQAGYNTSMDIMCSLGFKWLAVVWDIIRGTDRQQNPELEVYGPLMDHWRAGFFTEMPRIPSPTPTAQLRVLIPFNILPSQIGFVIPGWGNISTANCQDMLRFLPDAGHMTDGFNRQALHLRLLRASFVIKVMSALLEWLQTPTHSAGLAASGVLPMPPEAFCATIVRMFSRSREPEALDAFLATAEAQNPGHLTEDYLDEAEMSEDEQRAWLREIQAGTIKDDCGPDVFAESVGCFCMHCYQHFHGRNFRQPHPPIQDVVHLHCTTCASLTQPAAARL
ncbi:hypothetical protein WJX77_009823 [Trebouxia sp. C0004]